MPIDPRMVKWDDAPEAGAIDPKMVKWDDAPKAEKPNIRGDGFNKAMNYSGTDMTGGLVRGAGSIGASLLRALPNFLGGDTAQENEQRRTAMDDALKTLGADPDSTAFKMGKLGAELAGTMGAGGGLAKVAGVIPGVASKAPLLLEALRSGGMTLGGTTGSKLADMGLRMLSGSATGAGAAALINPEDVKTGAIIGGIAPPLIQSMGAAGHYLGSKASDNYAESLAKFKRGEPLRETVKNSVDAGYIIPPNMVNPSFKNAAIESFSGKQATGQLASVKNDEVTAKLARQALGLADDAVLTKSALEGIRKTSGNAYADVGNLSKQAADDLEALKIARNEAQGWFKAYNRSASPLDLAKAKDARETANNLEGWLEFHAADAGKQELIPALHEARKQIAKTYTVERALNDANGSIDARILGRMFDKKLPLSDGLDTIGQFASAFPSIAKSPQSMGSPAAHNLRSVTSLLMGSGGMAAAGPAGVAASAIPFALPAMSRSLMFREGAQKALANQATPKISSMGLLADQLSMPELQLLIARSAPTLSVTR